MSKFTSAILLIVVCFSFCSNVIAQEENSQNEGMIFTINGDGDYDPPSSHSYDPPSSHSMEIDWQFITNQNPIEGNFPNDDLNGKSFEFILDKDGEETPMISWGDVANIVVTVVVIMAICIIGLFTLAVICTPCLLLLILLHLKKCREERMNPKAWKG
jgi:hypothetical protein